jgi:hypothetical protein
MNKQCTKVSKKQGRGDKSIKYRCDYSSTPLKVLEARGWKRVNTKLTNFMYSYSILDMSNIVLHV